LSTHVRYAQFGAEQIDRLMRDDKVIDDPVKQKQLRTAEALGIEVPATLLAIAGGGDGAKLCAITLAVVIADATVKRRS